MTNQQIQQDSRRYFETLDPELLKQRIERFWKHDFARMSHGQICLAIHDVLTVDGRFTYPINMTTIRPGTQLLRIRHVPRDFIPTERDCWAPPKDKAGSNRLNREGEPWLYTSHDLASVFSEMPIPSRKIAMVMAYKVHKELKCSYPGFHDKDNLLDLTEQGRTNLDLVGGLYTMLPKSKQGNSTF